MNINEMSMHALIEENKALKCQVNSLLGACRLYGDGIESHASLDEADTIVLMTPTQCLNSIKANAILGFIKEVANIEPKGNEGTVKREYYKTALLKVYLMGYEKAAIIEANKND